MSKSNSRIGRLAEQHAKDRYDLKEPTHRREKRFYEDLETVRGNDPVEVKAASTRRSDGSQGRVRIFREPHKRLVARGGYYAIVAYHPQGRGISVDGMRLIDARDIERFRDSWYPSQHDTRGREYQTKIPISRFFDNR